MSQDIDFPTLDTIIDSCPNNTKKTLNLSPGTWLVMAWCTILTTNSSDTPKLAFELNGTETLVTFAGNTSGAFWENLAIEDIVTISSGDVFKVVTDKNVSNPATRSRIVAIKLN